MVGCIVVVSALPHALFHFVCDLKATKMNGQRCLIRKLRVHEFKLGYNAAESTRNI